MRKTIILTENQIRRVINTIVNEVGPQTGTTNDDEIPFNISREFESGRYVLSTTTEIDNAINEFKKYVEPGKKYVIEIESSESRVSNHKIIDPVTNKGMLPGRLSELRGDAVENYINSLKLPYFEIKRTNLVQGPKFNSEGGDNKDDKKFKDWQYVYMKLKGVKRKPDDDDDDNNNIDCLINLQISVDYRREVKTDDGKTVEHQCNDAIFMLTANGLPVMNVDRRDNFIDLQNSNDAGNRYNNLQITENDAKKILAVNNKEIKLVVYCMSNKDPKGCHSDPLLIGIKNNKGKELMPPKYIAVGGLKYQAGKHIMTLDSCGNVLNAAIAKGDDVKNTDVAYSDKLDTGISLFELDINKISSIAEIYKYVNKDRGTIEFPPKSIKGYMQDYKHWNHRKWSDFVYNQDIPEKIQQKLEDYMKTHPELYAKVQQEKMDTPTTK